MITKKSILRSVVSDNDWVCQMNWVPALSQVADDLFCDIS